MVGFFCVLAFVVGSYCGILWRNRREHVLFAIGAGVAVGYQNIKTLGSGSAYYASLLWQNIRRPATRSLDNLSKMEMAQLKALHTPETLALDSSWQEVCYAISGASLLEEAASNHNLEQANEILQLLSAAVQKPSLSSKDRLCIRTALGKAGKAANRSSAPKNNMAEAFVMMFINAAALTSSKEEVEGRIVHLLAQPVAIVEESRSFWKKSVVDLLGHEPNTSALNNFVDACILEDSLLALSRLQAKAEYDKVFKKLIDGFKKYYR